MNKALPTDDLLGILVDPEEEEREPLDIVYPVVASTPSNPIVDVESDYARSRVELEEQAYLLKIAAEKSIEDATSTGSPRSYEVFSGIMREWRGVTEQRLGIQKNLKDLLNLGEKKVPGTINAENVFIGTPNDLVDEDEERYTAVNQ